MSLIFSLKENDHIVTNILSNFEFKKPFAAVVDAIRELQHRLDSNLPANCRIYSYDARSIQLTLRRMGWILQKKKNIYFFIFDKASVTE